MKRLSLPKIPPRAPQTNKGDYGKIMVVAGSYGMAGAAYLCCKGALRSGAGLVYLCTPRVLYDILGSKLTCTVIYPQKSTPQGSLSPKSLHEILGISRRCDSAAIGCGLSQNSQTGRLLDSLLSQLRIPFVLDADGLNLISKRPEILKNIHVPAIITPHPGELSRLCGLSISQIQRDRRTITFRMAKELGVVMVLKGNKTIVTDGKDLYENPTGNPGMATGGSGDILPGMIATFLAQGFSPLQSAMLGVYIHGLAGDLAKRYLGEISMIATDILNFLPQAFIVYSRKYGKREGQRRYI